MGANKNTITLLNGTAVVSIIIACFFEGPEFLRSEKISNVARIWEPFSICFIKLAILITASKRLIE